MIGGLEIKLGITWRDHANFRDGLSHLWAGTCYVQPTYQIWSLWGYLLL